MFCEIRGDVSDASDQHAAPVFLGSRPIQCTRLWVLFQSNYLSFAMMVSTALNTAISA